MKNAKYVSSIMLVALMSFMGGCTNKYEALCDDLDKITDPAQRERLSKECNLPMPNTAEPTSQNSTPAQPPIATQQNSNHSYATPEKKRQSTIKKSQGILWGPGGMHP
jgi:hypothetical protein